MQTRNPNFLYAMDFDNGGRLRNVFRIDARNIAAYESFADIFTFDTMYLMNKYDMPFTHFVLFQSSWTIILLGCGLPS